MPAKHVSDILQKYFDEAHAKRVEKMTMYPCGLDAVRLNGDTAWRHLVVISKLQKLSRKYNAVIEAEFYYETFDTAITRAGYFGHEPSLALCNALRNEFETMDADKGYAGRLKEKIYGPAPPDIVAAEEKIRDIFAQRR